MEKPNERRPSTKIQWHPAFCAAAELELRFNKDDLEFKREYNLSKKPLQMDLLIIEKRCGASGRPGAPQGACAVLRSAYDRGAFAGSRISLWTIPRFSG